MYIANSYSSASIVKTLKYLTEFCYSLNKIKTIYLKAKYLYAF